MKKTLVALVGTKFRGDEAVQLLINLPQGEPLTLIREPDNKYDKAAVQVWARGIQLGYIKGNQNRQLAARMDRAALAAGMGIHAFSMPAKLAIDGDKQPMVEVDE